MAFSPFGSKQDGLARPARAARTWELLYHFFTATAGFSPPGAGGTIPRQTIHVSEHLVDRLEEEEIAPHHRFINAELFVEMVHAVFDNAFPARDRSRPCSDRCKASRESSRSRRGSGPRRPDRRLRESLPRFHKPDAAIAAAELSSMRSGPSGTSKSQGGTRLSGQRAR